MTQATLMFGIGATKAGTSWLYRYLDAHPDCAMPAVKELHYFDSDTAEKAARQAAVLAAFATEVETGGKGEDPARVRRRKARAERIRAAAEMLRAPRDGDLAYTTYLNAGTVGRAASLVGDNTPAYALLPARQLARMAALAPETRFVYILRDPIDRLWSNIRMKAMRLLSPGENPAVLAHRLMAEAIAGADANVMTRSDYAGTLDRLEAAVPENRRIVLFYEQLFSETTVKKLCAFLGIGYYVADTEKRIHPGQPVTLRPDLKQAAFAALKDQYAAVERRFGALPARWQNNMAKVSG